MDVFAFESPQSLRESHRREKGEELEEESFDDCPPCLGARHLVTFMLFLGMANAYIMRTNMSIAIVAMVNHTALPRDHSIPTDFHECPGSANTTHKVVHKDGKFKWDSVDQSIILSAFFYGYVVTQIPFGILSKKYGAKHFLGYGMLINSVFGFLVPIAAEYNFWALIAVRFIQGLGEGPIVPCTHAILAKWIPPNERSRMGAFVYAGAQFGTVLAMPISGFLSEYGFSGGWPSIFYVFGLAGTFWSLAFLFIIYDDPEYHPRIKEDEKKYIVTSVWGAAGVSEQNIPWKKIVLSSAFWAILVAHMAQNYGYETLLTQLPTFMQQILHFDIKSNGINSSLPYLAMWLFSMVASFLADSMITSKKFSITTTRKLINAIGQYGPAIALILASYTGCNQYLTVGLLTIGMGLNGAIYSGFKVNHLDISPRFAGILMSFTNCMANFSGLVAPPVAGFIINKRPTQAAWRMVFFIAAGVYVIGATIYLIFASGVRQPWDDNRLINQSKTRRKPENGSAVENGTTNGPKNVYGVTNGIFDENAKH
ncbi:putative inorganic phosphate cotransporter isoform X2 [Planococcus citri]|uniref:putative inorganic phosphate cotransporter isoform X2 n=1 Tax=Planococcus citri TaxID=170843 RepID=UPI0031FA0686